eukprot:m.14196 g.14196  ORF g.14196 m.14196 type:complete len:1391 (-) comp6355_c0_seq1:24-4196(-)
MSGRAYEIDLDVALPEIRVSGPAAANPVQETNLSGVNAQPSPTTSATTPNASAADFSRSSSHPAPISSSNALNPLGGDHHEVEVTGNLSSLTHHHVHLGGSTAPNSLLASTTSLNDAASAVSGSSRVLHLAGVTVGESRLHAESATETEDEDVVTELNAAARRAKATAKTITPVKGSPRQKRPSSAGSSRSSMPTMSIKEEGAAARGAGHQMKMLNAANVDHTKLHPKPIGARSTRSTPSPTPRAAGDLHEMATSVVMSHLEHEAEGDFNWGVPSLTVPFFLMQVTTLAQKLDTQVDVQHPRDSAGLTTENARQRLLQDGPNELTPPAERSEILKYLSKYIDPFMVLLWGAGILSSVAYGLDTSVSANLWVAVVLFAATFISATFTYVQEGRASAVMKSFKNLLPRHAHVRRDGRMQDVLARELVVGDIVVVSTGDQVPADLRVIYHQEMKVEKSALTGESVPVSVSLRAQAEDKLEDAPNIVLNTTKCVEGECVGVVIGTGDRSVIGRIASLATSTSNDLTPIQKEIKLFVIKLALFATCLGVIFIIIGLTRGRSWIDALINSFIVVIIACVPEGLPLTVVSCLTITAQRMAKQHVYVKQLRSVETLGSVSVIASDKTGTLTMNKMTVRHLWFDGHTVSANVAIHDYSRQPANLAYNTRDMHAGRQRGFMFSPTLTALETAAACATRCRYADEHMPSAEDIASSSAYTHVLAQSEMDITRFRHRPSSPMSTHGGAYFQPDSDDNTREIVGEGTELAVFNFARRRQNIEVLRYHNRVVFELPFNSRNKFSIAILAPFHKTGAMRGGLTAAHSTSDLSVDDDHHTHHHPRGPGRRSRAVTLSGVGQLTEYEEIDPLPSESYGCRIVVLKGAPEVVIARCTHYMDRGYRHPIDDHFQAEFDAVYKRLGSKGERVLGFAWHELSPEDYPPEMDGRYSWDKKNFPSTGLTFLGLFAMIDPPKPSVPKAIKDIRAAGVKVVMVTGDHEITAEAIARQVGIITGSTRQQAAKTRKISPDMVGESDYDAIVVHGRTIAGFGETEWQHVLGKREIVFARTTPEQKLQIVSQLQAQGNIVAVTGDGVNDSPALKKADIGVAMGISGSDVARDAADVVLLDDEFASIVSGIKYGRAIFDNLTKTIAYTVSHLMPEAIPVLLAIAFDIPAALGSLAILAIDLGSELAPAVSFAYEPPEGDVMARAPRKVDSEHLFSWKMALYCVFGTGAIELVFCYMGWLLIYDYYGIAASSLAWSSKSYWTDGASPLSIPSGCTAGPGCRILDESAQKEIASEAAGAYWWMLVMAQVMHIFMCKTRRLSLYTHGIWNNAVMIYGVGLEVALILIFIFIPKLNSLLVGLPFPSRFWPMFLAPWAALVVYNEGRKYLGRRDPNGFFAKYINW